MAAKKKVAKRQVKTSITIPHMLELGPDGGNDDWYWMEDGPCYATLESLFPGIKIFPVAKYHCPCDPDEDYEQRKKCTCRAFFLLSYTPANKRTLTEKKMISELKTAVREQRERDKLFVQEW